MSGEKVRILRIINRFNLGGITYNVSYLSRFLPETYETLLIGGPEETGEESSLYIPHSLGLQPMIVNEMRRSVNPISDYSAYRKIVEIIRSYKPDIVHTHASKAGALGRMAAIHCKVPHIVHTFHGHVFHGYFNPLVSSFVRGTERYFASKSSAIIAISNLQKSEICGRYRIVPPEKTHVVPLGFDLRRFAEDQQRKRAEFRSRFGLAEDETAVGIIGRLAPVKNHRMFIDAVASVMGTGTPFRAFVIGDGDIRSDLEKYAAARLGGNARYLTFTGWIREADVALAGLDIVALTSLNEGTPVSLIEAQAAGRFVVSTEVGGIRDILDPACGYLSPPGDTEKFAVNLRQAVENSASLSQSAKDAGKEVMRKFSYERLCSDMDGVYRRLLGGAKY
jgi:glycosyltransferase involved in cell wall biosynthesis